MVRHEESLAVNVVDETASLVKTCRFELVLYELACEWVQNERPRCCCSRFVTASCFSVAEPIGKIDLNEDIKTVVH